MKKTLLLFLIIIVNQTFAQRIAINEIDKFTDQKIFKVDVSEGKRWKTTDNIAKGLINNIFLSTRLIKKENSKIILSNFNFQLGRNLCVNPSNGKIIILFSDNSKITLKQSTEIVCESNLNVEYFIVDNNNEINDDLSILSNKEISSFRIYFNDGYIDFDVKEDKKELIRKHFKLISEEYSK
ncbi:hypothetical protein FCR2A7T_07110 [Flavobacterium cauense R2A-7]|nr:hypothetical protein [Flavobacterium cauense]ESU21140.1 hypothetical protein FCR2A7T_07110 [Flavobacterium cauense R2A-7]KGO79005.1 hypothetical protein Q762_14775 [Flavobacterium cauense R2A-7]